MHDLMDKYESKINAARLTKEQRKKMLDIVHRGGAAFTALEELEGIEVKTGDYLFKIDEKQRTLDALSKLSQEMIETIANEMSEPGMVVMPRIPHRKKPGRVILDALDLDALRHHKGQGKSEIVGNKRYAGLLLDQKREDNRVVIMDMTAVLKPMDFCLMDVFAFNTDGSDYCSNIYRKGLRFCNVAEYLVAAHQKMISGYATGFLDIGHKQTVPSDEWDRLVMRGCQYKHKSSQSIVERIYKDNQYHYLAMHFDNGYVLSVINRDYRIARDRYFGVRPAYTLIK